MHNLLPTYKGEQIVTPPTVLTGARLACAAYAAHEIVNGGDYALAAVISMGATDMDGRLARLLDSCVPNMGIGTTAFGKEADPIADGLSFALVSQAILRSAHTSTLAKAATGLLLGKETAKIIRFGRMTYGHYQETGRLLALDVNGDGQTASALAFGELAFAAATIHLAGPRRHAAGMGGLVLATAAIAKGEQAFAGYRKAFQQLA